MRDLLVPLFFFKRRAALAFALPLLVALALALATPPVFVADTRLLMLVGDDYVSHNPFAAGLSGLNFDRSQVVKAETEIIGSRELALATVQAVGIRRLYPAALGMKPEKAAEQFDKDLAVEPVPQSNVIRISLRNGNPQVAAQALNTLVSFYLDRRRLLFGQNDKGLADREGAELSQEVGRLETEITGMAAAHRFGDLQTELAQVANQEAQLTNQVQDFDRQLADRDARIAQLKGAAKANPARTELSTDYSRSLMLDGLEQALVGLQNQRREAAQEYVEGSPVVKDLDERIAAIEAQIATAPKVQMNASRQGVNQIRQDIDQRLSLAETDRAGIIRSRDVAAAQLQAAEQRLAELVRIAPQYRELARRRDQLDAAVTDLAKHSQDVRLANSISRVQTNVRVLQPARPPLESHTGRLMILLSGAIVGALSAGAAVILSAGLFTGMLTPNDVLQKLALPVVLTVNDNEDYARAPDRRPLPVFLSANDARMLAQVLSSIAGKPRCRVQFIGPDVGAGVTSLLVDFALHAAREGRKVLMLDLEPSKRAAVEQLAERHAQFEPVEGQERLLRVAGSTIWVARPALDGETVNEVEWASAVESSLDFDLVLIDAPPPTRSWLGLFASTSADVTVAVIQAEATRVPVALNMVERIGAAGGNVAFAIFNRRRFYIPQAIYARL